MLVSATQILFEHVSLYWTLVLICDRASGLDLSPARKVAPRVLLNQVCVVWPLTLLALACLPSSHSRLPWEQSAGAWLRAFSATLLSEFCVYGMHRALHSVRLLRAAHLVHHLPMRSSAHALYSTALEVALLNVLASAVPVVLFQVPQGLAIWGIHFGGLASVIAHAPRLDVLRHGVHHESPSHNYSTFMLADRLWGTYCARPPSKNDRRVALRARLNAQRDKRRLARLRSRQAQSVQSDPE